MYFVLFSENINYFGNNNNVQYSVTQWSIYNESLVSGNWFWDPFAWQGNKEKQIKWFWAHFTDHKSFPLTSWNSLCIVYHTFIQLVKIKFISSLIRHFNKLLPDQADQVAKTANDRNFQEQSDNYVMQYLTYM